VGKVIIIGWLAKMTFVNGRGYGQWNEKKYGKVVSHHVAVERAKKPSAYEIAVGGKIDFFDEKISELYNAGIGADKIAGTLRYEDGINIKKNPITKRLKELGIYAGDRRKKVVKVDHRAIEEEKDARITELERELERTKHRLDTRESELATLKTDHVRVRNERNDSDRKLRLVAEGIPVVLDRVEI
jgi:hypothetical protein